MNRQQGPNTLFFLVGIIAAMILTGCGGTDLKDPKEVAATFLEGYHEGDFDKVWEMMSAEEQVTRNESSIQADIILLRELLDKKKGLKSVEYADFKLTKNSEGGPLEGQVHYTVILGDNSLEKSWIGLKNTNEGWRVAIHYRWWR